MDVLNEIRTHHGDLADQILATAQDISKPYCYHCAALAVQTKLGIRCPTCFSDDLARLVDGVGCDWGFDWIVDYFIDDRLEPIDTDSLFEEHVLEAYGSTIKIGWIETCTAGAIRSLDPVSWAIAKNEHFDCLVQDGDFFECKSGKLFSIDAAKTAFVEPSS